MLCNRMWLSSQWANKQMSNHFMDVFLHQIREIIFVISRNPYPVGPLFVCHACHFLNGSSVNKNRSILTGQTRSKRDDGMPSRKWNALKYKNIRSLNYKFMNLKFICWILNCDDVNHVYGFVDISVAAASSSLHRFPKQIFTHALFRMEGTVS